MIIDCAHYRDGRASTRARFPSTRRPLDAGRVDSYGWVFSSRCRELAEVRQTFGLHELAVEDAQTFHLRPKFRRFDQDVQFVILRTARYDDAREEVDLRGDQHLSGTRIRDHRPAGVASEAPRGPPAPGAAPRAPAGRPGVGLVGDPGQGRGRLCAGRRGARRDIEDVEAGLSGAVAPTDASTYCAGWRLLSGRPSAAGAARHARAGIVVEVDSALVPYLRDVHDHLRLVDEEVAAQGIS